MKVETWKCVVAHFALLLAAISLTACGTLEERNFSATQQGTKTQMRADRAGACFGLDQFVPPPPTTPNAGEIFVGYENHLARGADPAPCNHRTNYDHQGVVKFDVSSYAPSDVITAAVLEADSRFVPLMGVTELSRDCQSVLQAASEAWADGDFRGPTTDPRAHVASEDIRARTWTTAGGPLSFNVLTTVRAWVNRSQPNNGFSMSGPAAHSFSEENLSCVFALRNFNLRVTRFVPDPPSP